MIGGAREILEPEVLLHHECLSPKLPQYGRPVVFRLRYVAGTGVTMLVDHAPHPAVGPAGQERAGGRLPRLRLCADRSRPNQSEGRGEEKGGPK